MKKKNIKKGRLATYTIFGLASVSLIAVGFSAWIIQSDTVEALGDVTVQVAEVDNQRVQILEATMTDDAFKLDAAANDTTGPIVWDGTNSEDLQLGFTFQWATTESANFNGINYRLIATDTVDNGEGTQVADPALSNFVSDTADTLISFPGRFRADAETRDVLIPTTAIGKNGDEWEVKKQHIYYNANSTGLTEVTDSQEITQGKYNVHVQLGVDLVSERYTATVTASFVWGSLFGNQNPSLYATNGNVDTVISNLNALKDAIDGKKFAFELTHPAN